MLKELNEVKKNTMKNQRKKLKNKIKSKTDSMQKNKSLARFHSWIFRLEFL